MLVSEKRPRCESRSFLFVKIVLYLPKINTIMAYKRLSELKELQRNGWSKDRLSKKIGISSTTLNKVLEGKPIFKRTEITIDYFLDNPEKPDLTIESLIEYKNNSKKTLKELSESIGVSFKTICNTLKFKPVSDTTLKLINNFLEKV